MGNLAFEGAGSGTPMAADTICRMGSMTKPVVAACAMTLVEDCTLRLDDPVDEFLPELANMTVLADPNGPLDETVPAERQVTLRDLLTFTLGTGIVPAEPGTIPIADALSALQSNEPGLPPDEWIRRLGTLPLVCQPGERWMYHTAANVTGVLIARATGMSFGDALRERICEPLGMKDTAFSVAGESISRLATAYQRDDATGEIVIEDGPDGYWSKPPAFEDGGGGLVSTADDYLAFASALLAGGTRHGERVLSRPSVMLMTSDHLTPAQKAVSGFSAGVLRRHRLGFRDVGPHPARAPRTLASLLPPAGLGRQLRMARHLRHRLVQRPGRGPDDNPHDPAGARAARAADPLRLLDGRLPGHRRLTTRAPPLTGGFRRTRAGSCAAVTTRPASRPDLRQQEKARRVTQQRDAGHDCHRHRVSDVAGAGEGGPGHGREGDREQASGRQDRDGPAPGQYCLHEQAECAERKQQAENGMDAQHGGPARDGTGQAAAMISRRDGHIQIHIRTKAVLRHHEHQNHETQAPGPSLSSGARDSDPADFSSGMDAHLVTS